MSSNRAFKRLLDAMCEKGFRQNELAHSAQISPQYLCDILNGRRRLSVNTSISLGAALNISPRLLLIAQMEDDLEAAGVK